MQQKTQKEGHLKRDVTQHCCLVERTSRFTVWRLESCGRLVLVCACCSVGSLIARRHSIRWTIICQRSCGLPLRYFSSFGWCFPLILGQQQIFYFYTCHWQKLKLLKWRNLICHNMYYCFNGAQFEDIDCFSLEAWLDRKRWLDHLFQSTFCAVLLHATKLKYHPSAKQETFSQSTPFWKMSLLC